MDREQELRKYVDDNYKPILVDYKATDGGKLHYPVYDKTMWPTIVEYIETEIEKAKQENMKEAAMEIIKIVDENSTSKINEMIDIINKLNMTKELNDNE